MRGYAIKQPLAACLFGLTLLAGCTQLPCAEQAHPARKLVAATGPCQSCRSASGAPYSTCFPRSAACVNGTSPAPCRPSGPTPCASAPAPKVVPVMIEAGAMAPAMRIAPLPANAKGCGGYQPCTLGDPCLPCGPCPTTCGCPPACATVTFQPVAEPGRLSDIRPGAGAGQVLPAPETAPRRRSFVDLTAAPCFGHAPDYSWVSGQIEYSGVRKEWRLRYASVDETDRFGGRIVLIETEHLAYLADGQYVRVQGHLVNPADAAGGRAFYRIEAFKQIDKANRIIPATAN